MASPDPNKVPIFRGVTLGAGGSGQVNFTSVSQMGCLIVNNQGDGAGDGYISFKIGSAPSGTAIADNQCRLAPNSSLNLGVIDLSQILYFLADASGASVQCVAMAINQDGGGML